LYTLHITWIEPLSSVRDDVALLWRSDPVKDTALTTWSESEDEAVRAYYPESPHIELMQAIPNKTRGQIKKRAYQLGVQRNYRQMKQTDLFHWTICFSDLHVVSQFASTEEERAFLWQEINTMAERTTRGQLAASWFLPVDMISFSHDLFVTNEIAAGQSKILA
jgi:hypothetical protein